MASFIASKISSATPISGSISEDSGSVGAVSGSGGAIDSSGDELTFSEELTPIVDGVSTSSISHWLRFSVAIVDKLTTSLIILGFSPFKSGMSIGSAVWGGGVFESRVSNVSTLSTVGLFVYCNPYSALFWLH